PLLLSSVPLIIVIVFYLLLNPPLHLYVIGVFILPILFILYFFRDPVRDIGEGIVSPADGKVERLDEESGTIEIFMNVWDVHVNRTPWSGKIKAVEYFEGSHFPAFFDEARTNERRASLLDTERGSIMIWQISGVLARRIVPYVKEGDMVKKGEKIGMIRFGSKVKLEFSDRVDFRVEKGQRVKAGKTTLGRWREEDG
ncbi:MAG: phosphatidylserine decarboxylase, partial [Candidatus Natronoplasma sp.]